LTEGIDVPAVDMVAFIDPRQSKIDIVQATGRAMRRSDEAHKTVGYIVVPLFIDSESEDNIESEIQGSKFEEIVAVLNALQEQDDDLADTIRNLREDRGRGNIFNPRMLAEKTEVIGDFVLLETITTIVVMFVLLTRKSYEKASQSDSLIEGLTSIEFPLEKKGIARSQFLIFFVHNSEYVIALCVFRIFFDQLRTGFDHESDFFF
jgi:superfamily II DNA or RNA helicase